MHLGVFIMNKCLTEVELVFIVCVHVRVHVYVNVVMFWNSLGVGNSK